MGRRLTAILLGATLLATALGAESSIDQRRPAAPDGVVDIENWPAPSRSPAGTSPRSWSGAGWAAGPAASSSRAGRTAPTSRWRWRATPTACTPTSTSRSPRAAACRSRASRPDHGHRSHGQGRGGDRERRHLPERGREGRGPAGGQRRGGGGEGSRRAHQGRVGERPGDGARLERRARRVHRERRAGGDRRRAWSACGSRPSRAAALRGQRSPSAPPSRRRR